MAKIKKSELILQKELYRLLDIIELLFLPKISFSSNIVLLPTT